MAKKLLDIDKKYHRAISILLIIFILIILSAVVISISKKSKKEEEVVSIVLNEGNLSIDYINGNEININDSKEHIYNISITNTSEEKIYYSILLDDPYISKNTTIVIKDEEDNVVIEKDNVKEDNTLIDIYSIEAHQTLRYKLIIDSKSNITFTSKIKVVNESITTETFSDLILINNNVVTAKTRLGYETAITNEGLISTNDSHGISYYFRGNVNNNYVKVGEYMFRIVRINGDGSVRLVLDDVITSEHAYNTNVSHNQALLENSSIISTLNAWMSSYLSEYISSIATSDYCNDATFKNNINGINYTDTYQRIYSNNLPTLECNKTIYKGKIGLLSIDEVIFAGAAANSSNQSYYLYNSNIKNNFITSSGYGINTDNNILMIDVKPDGGIGTGKNISELTTIRPVINIDISAKVKGKGTQENPYVIVS